MDIQEPNYHLNHYLQILLIGLFISWRSVRLYAHT